jgi:arylformamidase
MRLHDISVKISPQMVTWPGDPPVTLERVRHISEGANANVSRLACGVHTGTHVDAPVHFIEGERGTDTLALDVLIGPAYVAEIPGLEPINDHMLEQAGIPAGTERLLLKTDNSQYWEKGLNTFQEQFASIDADGAVWLVQHGVKLVGVDYLSVAPYKHSRPTHVTLLSAGVVIVEGMDLHHIEPGHYTLYCLPLRLVGSDGAPARAVLIEE